MKLSRETFEDFLNFSNNQFPQNLTDRGDNWDFELDVISIKNNNYSNTIHFSSVGTCREQWSDHQHTYEDCSDTSIDVNLSPEEFLKLESYYSEMDDWACENDYYIKEVRFLKRKKQLFVEFIVETEDSYDTWEYKL